jgi:hypothetical protein
LSFFFKSIFYLSCFLVKSSLEKLYLFNLSELIRHRVVPPEAFVKNSQQQLFSIAATVMSVGANNKLTKKPKRKSRGEMFIEGFENI